MHLEEVKYEPPLSPDIGTGVFVNRFPVVDRLRRIQAYRITFLGPDGGEILDGTTLSRILETLRPDEVAGGRPVLVRVRAETAGLLFVPTAWRRSIVTQITAREVDGSTLSDVVEGLRGQGVPVCLQLLSRRDLRYLPGVPAYILIDKGEADAFPGAFSAPMDSTLLVAAGVDTIKDFEEAKARGFDLFEGDFYAQPEAQARNSLSASQALLLDLSRATGRNEDIEDVEAIFRKDPDLAYGLLNLAHSAYFRVPESVTSIRHAIALLGYEQLHKWVAAMLFAIDNRDPASNPLFERALMRARTMECACWKTGRGPMADAAFVTGLFSLVHVVLGLPMEEVLDKTNLADDIREAILGRAGVLGFLLNGAEKAEQGTFNGGLTAGPERPITGFDVMAARTEAIMAYQAALVPTSPIALAAAVRQDAGPRISTASSATTGRQASPWVRFFGWIGRLFR